MCNINNQVGALVHKVIRTGEREGLGNKDKGNMKRKGKKIRITHGDKRGLLIFPLTCRTNRSTYPSSPLPPLATSPQSLSFP